MRGYRLSRQAEQTLQDVIGWTIDRFGVEQAVRYKDQLIGRLSRLAAGEVPHGRPCNKLISCGRDVVDLEYCREGNHYIIYLNTPEEILVLDFVHGSRNLEAIILELNSVDFSLSN